MVVLDKVYLSHLETNGFLGGGPLLKLCALLSLSLRALRLSLCLTPCLMGLMYVFWSIMLFVGTLLGGYGIVG